MPKHNKKKRSPFLESLQNPIFSPFRRPIIQKITLRPKPMKQQIKNDMIKKILPVRLPIM